MKWVVFGLALTVGVPMLALLLRMGERFVRAGILAFFLLLANDLNSFLSINIISREWYRGSSRGVEITALDLISLALLAFVLMRRPRGFARRWVSPEGLTFVFYIVMAGVSTYVAHVQEYALFGMWKLVRGLAIYFIFSQLIDRKERVAFIITCFALIPLMQAPVVFHQKYIVGIYRAYGTLPHMNTLAMLMNMTILPVLAVWLTVGRKPPFWHVLSALAAVFNVVATGSRGGMVALAASVGICFLFLRPRHLSPKRQRWLFLMIVGGTLGLAMSLDTIIRRFQTAPKASGQTRVELNMCATRMAWDFPLGVGLNNYSWMIGHTPYGDDAPDHPAGGKDDAVAHHIYWLTAAEMGFVGLAAFLVFIGTFQWIALRLALRAGDPLIRAFGIGTFAGLSALHMQGLLEWVLRQTNIWFLFCAVIGALTAARRLEVASRAQRRRAKGMGQAAVPGLGPRRGHQGAGPLVGEG